jgi:hypothetical protein
MASAILFLLSVSIMIFQINFRKTSITTTNVINATKIIYKDRATDKIYTAYSDGTGFAASLKYWTII